MGDLRWERSVASQEAASPITHSQGNLWPQQRRKVLQERRDLLRKEEFLETNLSFHVYLTFGKVSASLPDVVYPLGL